MPINYKEYHPKWTLIRRLILKRAAHRCEECGIENKAIILRLKNGDFERPAQALLDMVYACIKPGGHTLLTALKKHGLTRIVLTIAHLDHDKTNNRFNNLRALCQRCHLKIDMGQHIENRKYGRHWKKVQFKLDL